MKKSILVLIISVITLAATAQLTIPAPSPGASFTQKFGLTEIRVDYSRPGVKGRKIFGAVVPFGDIWRAGANEPTKFTTTDSITVGGMGLAKGSYVVLVRPSQTDWEVIFNKNPEVSYTNYKPADDVIKVKVPTQKNAMVESFTIAANNVAFNKCDLEFSWENTLVRLPLVNETDAKITAQIQQRLDGPTGGEYQAMARYYYDMNKDAKKALDLVDMGIKKGGEGMTNLWLKSMLQARLGDKKGASVTATNSLERAKKANNQDYIRMNEKNLAEWK